MKHSNKRENGGKKLEMKNHVSGKILSNYWKKKSALHLIHRIILQRRHHHRSSLVDIFVLSVDFLATIIVFHAVLSTVVLSVTVSIVIHVAWNGPCDDFGKYKLCYLFSFLLWSTPNLPRLSVDVMIDNYNAVTYSPTHWWCS